VRKVTLRIESSTSVANTRKRLRLIVSTHALWTIKVACLFRETSREDSRRIQLRLGADLEVGARLRTTNTRGGRRIAQTVSGDAAKQFGYPIPTRWT
jgi:hypothetical protein